MAPFYTVHHGKTYKAKLKLSWFESMASNEMIAEKFHEIGFIHVTISGSGDHRWATGVWNGPDESVPLTDEHIESVIEVTDHKTGIAAPVEEPYITNDPVLPGAEEKYGTPGDIPGHYHGGPKMGLAPGFKDEKDEEEWNKLHQGS